MAQLFWVFLQKAICALWLELKERNDLPGLRKNRLHLVEATTMLPVFNHLRNHTSKAENVLSKSGISPDLFERTGSYIPLNSMVRFINLAARASGDQLYGWSCVFDGPVSSAGGLFQGHLGRELTAYESLVKFTRLLNLKSSGGIYWCEAQQNKLFLLRTTEPGSPVDNWMSEQFVLATYIKILSEVLGRHVVPNTVTLRESVVPVDLPETLRGCRIISGHRNTSISVTVRGSYTHKNLSLGLNGSHNEPGPEMSKVKSQLLKLVLLKNGAGIPSLTSMSEAFGLSTRSLQRQLSELGLTYSEIKNELRFRQCLEALSDPTLNIASIGFEVGFRNPGDFSRAFSSRMGISPREYRRQLLGGQ